MERFKLPDDQPMEAKILSNQIENAQKKVEEQNFVARKNVLKYDDVMDTQRTVIYEQRRRVLEGDDLSEDVRDWIREVVEANVRNATEAEFNEEWDLAALVQQMQGLSGTDITVQELNDEVELEREALIEEFVEDALETYDEKEQEYGDELMREIERYVILQVVDSRWRSHLDSMDYLRDGIHFRAMALKDPLAEYRAEGHAMFNDLRNTIREEVVLTLFHAQVEHNQPQLEPEQGNGNLQYAHETAAGAEAIAAAGAGRRLGWQRPSRPRQAARPRLRPPSTSTRTSAATTRAGAVVARSSRSATAPDTLVPAAPDGSLHRRLPVRQGPDRGVGTPVPGWPLSLSRLPQASRSALSRVGESPEDAVTIEGEDSRLRRAVLLSPLRFVRFRAQRDEVEVNLGALDAPDQLRPTYELWTVRREPWLPPFPLTRRDDRDREAAGRSEK